MFQFRRFPTYCYFIHSTLTRYCRAGFPHSEIHGSKDICSSPWLIAACRVLLRLLMPRHSPCALISLNFLSCMRIANRLLSCSAAFAATSTERPSNFLKCLPILSFARFAFSYSVFNVLRYPSRRTPSKKRLYPSVLSSLLGFPLELLGGLKWIRTTDLALIRRTL